MVNLTHVAVMLYTVLGEPLAYTAGLTVVLIGLIELPSRMSAFWTKSK